MSTTLSDLVSKLRGYMKMDPNDAIWSTSAKQDAINVAYQQVQRDGNFKWPENEATVTFNTVGGTQEYAFPTYIADFAKLDMVQFTDTTGELYPYTKSVALRNALSGTGRPSNYYLYNKKLGFYPTPDTSYPVRVLYRKRLPTLTDSVDSEFDEDFDDAIVMYAAYKTWATTKNSPKASQALNDYSMALNRLKMSYLFQDSASLSFPVQRDANRRYKYDPKVL